MKKMIVLFIILLMSGCEKVGEGKKAELGFRRSKVVITALDKYHQANGKYPKLLEKLIPEFLNREQLKPPLSPKQKYPFKYKLLTSGFSLSFRYYGPGMNICSYSSVNKKWQCHGYY